MKTENATRRLSLAKFTPPGVEACLPRERLFRQIDAARQQAGIWIAGPGGSGKTVLVASYLASRQLPFLWMRLDSGDSDAATFFHYLRLAAEKLLDASRLPAHFAPENSLSVDQYSRAFFREFYQALPPGSVIVFDNSHEQMLTEQAMRLIKTAIIEAPIEITVIITSRKNPPAMLSASLVSGALSLLGWDALSFEAEELRQLAEEQPMPSAEKIVIEQAIAQANGWIVGFLLMLRKRVTAGIAEQSIETASEQALFDYFVSEIFEDLQKDEQEFLLKTAFLPILNVTLATRLTGSEKSAAYLNHLVRGNYFTVSHQGDENSFEYHPLFRQFLLAQAQQLFDEKQRRRLQCDTAEVLVTAGHAELAVPLLIEAEEWRDLTSVIPSLATELLAQGRYQRLSEWLACIPDTVKADAPWLVYWEGIAQMALDTERSYRTLNRAYEQFEKTADIAGICMAWAGAVESLVHTLAHLARMDIWQERLQTILDSLPAEGTDELRAILAPQVVAIAALRGSSGVDIAPWLAITQSLLLLPIDPTQRITASFVLVSYYIWHGEMARVEQLLKLQEQILKERGLRPLARITAKLSVAWFAWISGDVQRCRTAIEKGLAIAEESGVQNWNTILRVQNITAALLHSNVPQARKLLRELEPLLKIARDFDRTYYHNEQGWLEMLDGRPDKALMQQRLALELAESVGAPFVVGEVSFGLSQALSAVGEQDEASLYLERVDQLAKLYRSHTLAFQSGLLQAWFEYQQGDLQNAATTLSKTYRHAIQNGYSAFAWWLPEQLTELCAFSLAKGIEPRFVRNLIQRFELPPPAVSNLSLRWPWPVRIETLGSFAIIIDEQPLQFSGKAQLRPLDLIKALITLGGEHVSSERLAETLWPDAEGDAAGGNLQTTIHRVRKLLKYDRAIIVEQGMISLNPKVVWVDVLALLNTLKGIEREKGETIPQLAEDILGLYRGEFLAQESSESWVLPMREYLRVSLTKGLQKLMVRLRAVQADALAVRINALAVEIDPYSEECHRSLMAYHALTGEKSKALALYAQLIEALKIRFNTTPSLVTRELAEAISADNRQAITEIASSGSIC